MDAANPRRRQINFVDALLAKKIADRRLLGQIQFGACPGNNIITPPGERTQQGAAHHAAMPRDVTPVFSSSWS